MIIFDLGRGAASEGEEGLVIYLVLVLGRGGASLASFPLHPLTPVEITQRMQLTDVISFMNTVIHPIEHRNRTANTNLCDTGDRRRW